METRTKEITNSEDIIDSRDIEERIHYLETLEDEMNESDKAELETLKGLREEYNGSDWEDGVALVRDSYFKDYAIELAEDTGAIGTNYQWPLNHIDWEAAAQELLIDYTQLDFDGVTYYAR